MKAGNAARRSVSDSSRGPAGVASTAPDRSANDPHVLQVRADLLASMRKELIDTLGMERARGLLLRAGYAAGAQDAQRLAGYAPRRTDVEAFGAYSSLGGPDGVNRMKPVRLEIDRARGHFLGEFEWNNSWEGSVHMRHFGIHTGPVCWTQLGYACGYASTFMGRPILFQETACVGAGDARCRIVGKPAEEWRGADIAERDFEGEKIADLLLDLQAEIRGLHQTLSGAAPEQLLGSAPPFEAARAALAGALSSSGPVLITGEPGVGKHAFALSLHENGARAGSVLMALNCARTPPELLLSELFGVEQGAESGASDSRPGLIEAAHGGVLLLEAVEALPTAAQSRLMQFLREGRVARVGDHGARRVDVCVVATADASLLTRAKRGQFSLDLYNALAGIHIAVPALRERRADVPLLAGYFLSRVAAAYGKQLPGFSADAMAALACHSWVGNLDELRNVVERAVILTTCGAQIEAENLFPAVDPWRGTADVPSGDCEPETAASGLCDTLLDRAVPLDKVESLLIQGAVRRANGNLSLAARQLGITRPQLAYRLKCLRAQGLLEGDLPVKRHRQRREQR